VHGSGNWLDGEDSENVTAYGRPYKYNLNRDLETIDFQMGVHLGKRGLLSASDILVFGALGGFVNADLDYDANPRAFDYQGGQVGAYATYLRGGLFVDTLLNVHLMEIDTGHSLGFPGSLDATTVGVRTDSGYRFGSSMAGRSSSLGPSSPSTGPISTASPLAATRSPSTTTPMCVAA
jgi:autotransporter family porin